MDQKVDQQPNTKHLVDIIIPTFNNPQQLEQCIVSMIRARTSDQLFRVIIVNNGHEDSCNWIDKEHKFVKVVNTGKNLGWDGGIMEGLKHSDSEFVMFLNDDTFIPGNSRLWINNMLQHFRDQRVAAVGPSSNMVMGFQNMLARPDVEVFTTKFLIGFCVLMRRSAFDEIGGMDLELPGGDDFDWSIRYRDAGYKLIVDRNVFVYHYGCQTGNRLFGDYHIEGGWNSPSYSEKVDTSIIRKHGFAKWWEIREGAYRLPSIEYGFKKDTEGDLIRERVSFEGLKTIDVGCGNLKTVPEAIGIDIVPGGDIIPQIGGDSPSVADISADISKPLPLDDESVDIVISRHVLEHMLDPINAVRNWSKVLKTDGKMVISIPNENLIRSIPMNPEHFHAWTPETFPTYIAAVGGLEMVEMWDSENGISFTTVCKKI